MVKTHAICTILSLSLNKQHQIPTNTIKYVQVKFSGSKHLNFLYCNFLLLIKPTQTCQWQKVFCKNVLMRAYVTLTFLENKVFQTSYT